MKYLSLIAGLAVIAVSVSANARSPEASGHALVEAKCANCHAIGRADKSRHEHAPPLREIARKYKVENLAEALAEGIVVGHPDMPEYVFNPDEIAAILAYLNELARDP